jgi:pimeloyl-ACP methyl ester carboxylesterase
MDATHTSQQLHAILEAANEKPPCLVVGHSIGGAYARMFAAEHCEEVAGLVLVDATNPPF